MNKKIFVLIFLTFSAVGISQKSKKNFKEHANLIDFVGSPLKFNDRNPLVFSDKGSWFGFAIPQSKHTQGFTGPFIMSQNYGEWLSPAFLQFKLKNLEESQDIEINRSIRNFTSGLNFSTWTDTWRTEHSLFFLSSTTAIFKFKIENLSNQPINFQPQIHGEIFNPNIAVTDSEATPTSLDLKSDINNFHGKLILPENTFDLTIKDSSYTAKLKSICLDPKKSQSYFYSFSFFDSSDYNFEFPTIDETSFQNLYSKSLADKEKILETLYSKLHPNWDHSLYHQILQKTLLTLQTNWRSASGGFKFDGFFPSYHYKWFYGFWAWDSWKHAVAVAQYNTLLAKDQIRALYYYQTETGFIPDCVYRDNLIEQNNYRNTKPPLSAWAVWEIYNEDLDKSFVAEIYPNLKLQHQWWYQYRDHDSDGICEYGSTDGTLIAAKWESGMDNAVRFDHSEIVKNSQDAYSINQESVDLNSYLYAEKLILAKLANILDKPREKKRYKLEARLLKKKIQNQFFDHESGWFYDTSLDGNSFIKVKGSEGWIPLWANVATIKQALAVKSNMMDKNQFNTTVPLQTLNASHDKFEPEGGYWRGPTWIDQAYFGIQGLKNYKFNKEADHLTLKLFKNAEGITTIGSPIRENYNPITGAGLEAYNFSWSAAHYLLLLLN